MIRKPPPALQARVGGNFDVVGRAFIQHLKNLAGLTSSSSVLDVGCGAGRIALPLQSELTSGRYVGFDCCLESIDWCRENIKQFSFIHADIQNELYNPRGAIPASRYSFPETLNGFDVVLLASVFTHMLPQDVAHYLQEIHRVLNSSGCCLATAFIVALGDMQRENLLFVQTHEDYAAVGNIAVAYSLESFTKLAKAADLEVTQRISGFQDLFVLKRRNL